MRPGAAVVMEAAATSCVSAHQTPASAAANRRRGERWSRRRRARGGRARASFRPNLGHRWEILRHICLVTANLKPRMSRWTSAPERPGVEPGTPTLMPTAANVGLRPLSLGAPAQGRIDADGEEARPVVGGLHRHLRDRLPAAVRTRENVCAALSASLTERTAGAPTGSGRQGAVAPPALAPSTTSAAVSKRPPLETELATWEAQRQWAWRRRPQELLRGGCARCGRFGRRRIGAPAAGTRPRSRPACGRLWCAGGADVQLNRFS